MARTIVHSGPKLPRIVHTGPVLPRVDPKMVAEALGAEGPVARLSGRGSPISLLAVRQAIWSRLRSTGGRPGLDDATKRAKVPLSDETWARLEEIAAKVTDSGVNTTPGQVASVLLHLALDAFSSDAAPEPKRPARARRPARRAQATGR